MENRDAVRAGESAKNLRRFFQATRMPHKIQVVIDDKQHHWLSQQANDVDKIPGVIRRLIDTQMTQVAFFENVPNVTAYLVGAGYKGIQPTKAQHEINSGMTSGIDVCSSSEEKISTSVPPLVPEGEGVGMGSGETPRKGEPSKPRFYFHKSIPDDLEWCRDGLISFWRVKKGAKSEIAAKLLFTGVRDILKIYGREVVLKQLVLAAANNWNSVTLQNYEKFGKPAQQNASESKIDWDALDNVSLF